MERGLKLPSYEMLFNFIKATGKDANFWFGIDTPENNNSVIVEPAKKQNTNNSLSVDKMKIDTLSAFFRDRVKDEVDNMRDVTFERIHEDIEELYILLKKERTGQNRLNALLILQNI